MKIHAVVISFNTKEMTGECLGLLTEQLSFTSFTITLVDNGSGDGTSEYVRQRYPSVKVIALDVNMGFARACNIGFKSSPDNDYTFFVNTDTRPLDGSLKKILNYFEKNPGTGVISGMLLNTDHTIQNTYSAYPDLISGLFGRSLLEYVLPKKYPSKKRMDINKNVLPVDCVVGAFFCVRSSVIKDIGGFDERYFFFLEETDLCCQIKNAGYSIVVLTDAEVVHFQGGSANKAPVWSRYNYHRSFYQYMYKWHGLLPMLIVFLKNILKSLLNTIFYCLLLLITFNAKFKNKLKVARILLIAHFKGFPYFSCYDSQKDFLSKRKIIDLTECSEGFTRLSDFLSESLNRREKKYEDIFAKSKSYLLYLSDLGIVFSDDFPENIFFNAEGNFFIKKKFPLKVNLIQSAIINNSKIKQFFRDEKRYQN